ncbi:MAG: hypothetical protein COB33_015620 [Thiotrichaceae bacterium]|nr:hypothetical protein [Thiotrichaceae bacterium]MBL1261937.1 hypothetical protein [Thiotrichaceae bacterium]
MKSAQKKDFWQRHIQAWEQSKLPQKAYCQQHNISYANFGYWRTRLKRLENPVPKLVPVTLTRPTMVIMTLSMGIRIEVPTNALAEVLSVVVRSQQEIS